MYVLRAAVHHKWLQVKNARCYGFTGHISPAKRQIFHDAGKREAGDDGTMRGRGGLGSNGKGE